MCHWKVDSVNWGWVKTSGSLLLPAGWPRHILGNQAISHSTVSGSYTSIREQHSWAPLPGRNRTAGPEKPASRLGLWAARLPVWSTSIPDVQQKWPGKRQVDCEFKRLLPAVHLISIFENNKVWLESIWSMLGGSWKWCHRSPRCYLTSPASRESIHAKANETKHMPWLPATQLWWDKEENGSCVIIF